jgi:hypothetical protein
MLRRSRSSDRAATPHRSGGPPRHSHPSCTLALAGAFRASIRRGATLSAFAFAFGLPGSADAQRFDYCGVNVSSGTWCGRNDINHSYYGQYVISNGAVTWEHMFYNNTTIERAAAKSASGAYVERCYTGPGGTTSQFEAEGRQTGGGSHLVAASAFYGTQSPYMDSCLV